MLQAELLPQWEPTAPTVELPGVEVGPKPGLDRAVLFGFLLGLTALSVVLLGATLRDERARG